jgi:hypothetical protein
LPAWGEHAPVPCVAQLCKLLYRRFSTGAVLGKLSPDNLLRYVAEARRLGPGCAGLWILT